MKGMIFAGCSFTWGQGLYFYSDLPKLPYSSANSYDFNSLTDSHLRFKDTLRFPRLVANHFNTFEVVKKINGGQNDEAIEFLDVLFSENLHSFGLTDEKYTYNDIDYIIFQSTQAFRDVFIFKTDLTPYWNEIQECDYMLEMLKDTRYGKDVLQIYFAHEFPEDKPLLFKIFYDYLEKNNITLRNFQTQFLQNSKNKIKNKLQFFEKRGIKTLILIWTDDLLFNFYSDEWMNERIIKLNYDSNEFLSIESLINKNENFKISGDPYFRKKLQDDHPSKKCHEIIAKSIINKIENG